MKSRFARYLAKRLFATGSYLAAFLKIFGVGQKFRRLCTSGRRGRGAGTSLSVVHIEREKAMALLRWALIFALVSAVAAVFGLADISATSADIARTLFYVYLVIFLVLLVLGLRGFRA